MGLPNALPFYNQNGSIENLVKGLNFGSADATIMNPGNQGYQTLNQQLRQVFETSSSCSCSSDRGNSSISSDPLSSTSPSVKMTTSTFFSAMECLSTAHKEIAHILANEMVQNVRSLHDLKVRKIICQGILPLGCTPRTMWKSDLAAGEFNGAGCWKKINEVVLEYNGMLEEKIMELNAERRDAYIVFCDGYQGIRQIIAKPRSYGFENVKRACCGLGLYGTKVGCLSVEMACNRTESHVWWDQYNPTKAANCLLADSAWSAHPFPIICRPMSIQELVNPDPSRLA